MSAYIVQDKTINQIVTHVHLSRDLEWLKQEFAEAIGPCENFGPDLGRALFLMNIDAITARYGKGQAKEFRTLDYKFRLESASELRVYHAIAELVYQCSEGAVPESKLYKLLVELKAAVADSIIDRWEPSRGWSGTTGPGHEGDAFVAALLDELENSLEARCERCCKGLEHSEASCGAPAARRLLVGAGRVSEKGGGQ